MSCRLAISNPLSLKDRGVQGYVRISVVSKESYDEQYYMCKLEKVRIPIYYTFTYDI